MWPKSIGFFCGAERAPSSFCAIIGWRGFDGITACFKGGRHLFDKEFRLPSQSKTVSQRGRRVSLWCAASTRVNIYCHGVLQNLSFVHQPLVCVQRLRNGECKCWDCIGTCGHVAVTDCLGCEWKPRFQPQNDQRKWDKFPWHSLWSDFILISKHWASHLFYVTNIIYNLLLDNFITEIIFKRKI